MASRVVFDRSLPPARLTISDGEAMRTSLWLSGEIDGESASILRAELLRQQLQQRRLVRVDVHAVTFIDTAVLCVLVEAHYAFLRMRGTLVLFGVSGPMMRMLTLTGMDRELLHMPPTADDVRRRDLISVGA